jgi:hypothetical protein
VTSVAEIVEVTGIVALDMGPVDTALCTAQLVVVYMGPTAVVAVCTEEPPLLAHLVALGIQAEYVAVPSLAHLVALGIQAEYVAVPAVVLLVAGVLPVAGVEL